MSLSFLDPSARAGAGRFVPTARSPMEAMAVAAGARLERRDGWNVPVSFGGTDHSAVVGFADVSHLRKLELQGEIGGAPNGMATRASGSWWCPLTPTRELVIGGTPEPPAGTSVVDLTGALCALTIVGPQARETIARFCALDLRPHVTPVAGLRPGSVARTPGFVIREAEERFLLLVGSAYGEYLWTVVADAAGHLGGGPIGVDALPDLPEALDA
jgi:glycine cleavage system aminomethyltransferase T